MRHFIQNLKAFEAKIVEYLVLFACYVGVLEQQRVKSYSKESTLKLNKVAIFKHTL